MRYHQRQAIFWLLFVLLCISGCMGRGLGDGLDHSADPGLPPQSQNPAESELFPGMPGLPSGELDSAEGLPRIAVAIDNIQTGDMAQRMAPVGTELQGSDLLLSGSTSEYSWGIWRWGTFTTNDFPQQLILDYSVGAGVPSTYLALSNYTTGRWEVMGLLDGSNTTFGYPGNSTFLSENRNTYVAIIQSFNGDSTVVSLNLRANKDVTPPAPPTGLVAETVLPTRVSLQWDDNTEGDLEGYNVYTGTGPDFKLTDPGTEKVSFSVLQTSDFLHDLLNAETDYFYRVTAQDSHDNESEPSAVLQVSTPFDDLPGAPTDLQVISVGSKSALVSWTEPTDPDIKGYRVYVDPDMNFTVPPVTHNNPSLILVGTNQYTITGLDPSTEYYFRVRAIDLGIQDGPLSAPGNFTTLDNSPPVPDFETSPSTPGVGLPVTFNPGLTTDEDNDLSELSFEWDFDNSGGAPDAETTGAQAPQWTYPARGIYTVKLTADDGVVQASITRDILVSYNQQYQLHGDGKGNGALVVAVDGSDDGRLAVLFKHSGNFYVDYFNGTLWIPLTLEGVTAATVYDVALGPGKVGVVTAEAQIGDNQIVWTAYEWAGSNWVSEASGSVSNRNATGNARLCYSPDNGRLSVAVTNHPQPPDQQTPKWDLDIWHEKADGLLANYKAYTTLDNYDVDLDLVRSDSTTLVTYSAAANALRLGTATDAAFNSAVVQTVSGAIVDVRSELNPDDSSQAYWYCLTATPRIYYGDNFGAANGAAQFIAPTRTVTAMLGLQFNSDNNGTFYWTDIDTSGVDHYNFHRTSDATTTDIESAVGFASGGAGAPFNDGVNDLVFNVLNEVRDGEISGRYMDADTEEGDELIYEPLVPTGATTTHLPVLMADGSVVALSQESVPTAMLHHFPSVSQNAAATQYTGFDNYADPASACRTAVDDEYFLASTTIQSRLLLYRFNLSSPTGTLELNTGPVQKVRLAFNPVNNQTLVAYTNDNNHDIQVRSWNGTVWSSETTVYNGSLDLPQFELRPQADGEWGLAFFDSGSNLRLAETNAGVWQAAVSLGTDTLSAIGGMGFDYHSDGSYAIVVERQTVPGVYVGIDPLGQGAGGLLAWEKVEDTSGSNAYSCKCFYHDASPVVGYHHSPGGISALSRFRIYEKFGSWRRNEINVDIQGLPIGATQDSNGDILLLGFSLVNVPYRVVSLALTN